MNNTYEINFWHKVEDIVMFFLILQVFMVEHGTDTETRLEPVQL